MSFYKFIFKKLGKKNTYLFIILFLTVINNIFLILLPILQKNIIDNLYRENINYRNLVLIIFISLVTILISFISSLSINSIIIYFKRILQEELLSASLYNNEIIEKKGPGAYLVSIFGDSEQMANLLSINIFEVLFQTVSVAIILIITLKWSPLFLQIVLPSYLIAIIFKIYAEKKYVFNFQKAREFVYEANPKVLEFIENRDSIIEYSNINEYKKELYYCFDQRDKYFLKANIINDLESQFTRSLKRISNLIFFIISIFLILEKKLEISAFIALTTYFSYIFLPLDTIKDFTMGIQKFNVLQNKIKDSLSYKKFFKIPKNNDLKMINCSFSYEENCILSNLSIYFDEKLGLVGLSGEGKTTLIKLLLGKISPTHGKCIYGEEETTSISKYILRSSIRYYKQEAELFNNTIQENICLKKYPINKKEYLDLKENLKTKFKKIYFKVINNEDIKEKDLKYFSEIFMLNEKDNCLNIVKNIFSSANIKDIELLANIWVSRNYYIIEKYEEIIQDLNLEYLENRKIGQRGDHISGGEKNRIMLARFLLPEFGDLYVIDEPFTGLDKITEKQCLNVLKKYLRNMKGITISHKLNIIKFLSDNIIVLENGKLAAKGSHIYLYENNSLYKEISDLSEKSD